MPAHIVIVHPLSVYADSSASNSIVIDLGDSVELHGLLKVTAVSGTSPSFTVTGQHSIDGHQWDPLSGLAFSAATGPTVEVKSATAAAFRFLRFKYSLAGTNPVVTFELQLFFKTRS